MTGNVEATFKLQDWNSSLWVHPPQGVLSYCLNSSVSPSTTASMKNTNLALPDILVILLVMSRQWGPGGLMTHTAVSPDETSTLSARKESLQGTELRREQVISLWEAVLWSSSNSHAYYWEITMKSPALSLKCKICAIAFSPTHSSYLWPNCWVRCIDACQGILIGNILKCL